MGETKKRHARLIAPAPVMTATANSASTTSCLGVKGFGRRRSSLLVSVRLKPLAATRCRVSSALRHRSWICKHKIFEYMLTDNR